MNFTSIAQRFVVFAANAYEAGSILRVGDPTGWHPNASTTSAALNPATEQCRFSN